MSRYRILIPAVVAAAVIGAYWMLLLAPKRQEATKLQTQVTQQQANLAEARSTLANYQEAQSKYRANYATLVRLGKAVPVDDDVRSLIVQLNSASRRSGVSFTNVDIAQGSTASGPSVATKSQSTAELPPGAVSVGSAGFSAMPFSFGFQGTFRDLSGFLGRLQRLVTVNNRQIGITGRLLRVESIDLQPDDNEGGYPLVEAHVSASSYLLPPLQGLTGGATPQGSAATLASGASSTPSGGSSSATTTTATATGVTP